MRKLIRQTSLLLAMLMVAAVSYAQEALWQLDFEKGVQWTKMTDAGILLVGTGDRMLHGVDSRDGNLLWSNDIMKGSGSVKGADGKKLDDNVAFDNFVTVLEDPDYPELGDFIEVKYSDAAFMPAMGDGVVKNYAIINIRTGELVMSPEKAGMPVTKFLGKQMAQFNFTGTGYIPELRMVMISGSSVDPNYRGSMANPDMVHITKMVSLPDAEIVWESDQVSVNVRPYVMSNGDLVMPGGNVIMRMDSKTGAVKWSVETTEKKQTFESFDLSLDLSTGYFFEKRKNNGALVAHDMETGKRLWEAEMKLKEVPMMYAMGYGVVTVDSKNFTLYDLKSGEIKWEKKKLDGYTVDLGDMGILVTAKEKFLVMLNKETGDEIWEQKIKGIQIDRMTGGGIMYSDDKGRLGLISYDGELIWDKKGMLEVPNLRYRPDFNTELMYIEGDLFEVDLSTGDYRLLVEKMDKKILKGEDSPTQIQLINDGYLFSNDNELVMLDKNGAVRWQKYWEPPGMSLAAKIALRTAQIAVAAMGAAAQMESEASKVTGFGGIRYETYQSRRLAEQAAAFYAASGAIGQEARRKFKATVTKGDDMLVLTRVGEGGQKNSSGLIKVKKSTGEELGSLQLGDKEPVYDYDALTSSIFFKADKKQVICYKI